MLTKSLSAALLGATLLAAPAMAQQNSPAGPDTAKWLTQESPGQWRTSKLDGLDVYNNNDEKIGDIKELLVDNSGKIQAVVIGVGGFLGMGEHDVALPFDQIKFENEPRARAAASNAGANNAAGTNAAGTNAGANPTGTANTGVVANTTTGVTTPANPNAPAAGTTAANNNAAGVNSTGAVTTASRDTGNRAAPDHAMLNMSKDQLKAAPEFKYAR
jgi:sporulation protein YlmC with PRC-barrel domain